MLRWCFLLCPILLACCAPAAAQAAIHRCIGADGHPVFTDQPCAALGATPVTNRTPALAAPGEPPPILCATDRAALRQAVVDAFASGDANRLAGLMLWDGEGQRAVVEDIGTLADMMKQPLLDIDTGDGPAPAPAPPLSPGDAASSSLAPVATAPQEPDLVLHTAGGDGSGYPHELRFPVERRAGCLWLRSPD